MLLHGVEVDQRPTRQSVIPEQVVPLEITVADAFAQQRGEQAIKRLQIAFRGRSVVERLKTRDYILPAAVFGNQVGTPAQPAPAPL